MADNSTYIPTTWPELLAHLESIPNSTAQNFMYFYQQYRDLHVTDARFGPLFFGAVDALARGVIMGQGGQIERPLLDSEMRAQAVATGSEPELARLTVTNVASLAVAGVSAVMGRPATGDLTMQPLARLMAQEPDQDAANRQTVWAHLAWGQAGGLAPLIRQDPADAPPDPGARFGASIRNIQTHLARCIVHGAGPGLAASAWQIYKSDFPGNIAAEQATWPELFWAARAVHVHIHGGAEDQTLDWLLSQLR